MASYTDDCPFYGNFLPNPLRNEWVVYDMRSGSSKDCIYFLNLYSGLSQFQMPRGWKLPKGFDAVNVPDQGAFLIKNSDPEFITYRPSNDVLM